MRNVKNKKPKTADGTSSTAAVAAKAPAILEANNQLARNALCNWFAGLGDNLRIEVIAKNFELLEQNTGGSEATPDVLYRTFLHAVKLVQIEQSVLSRKEKVDQLRGDKLAQQRLESFKQPRRKKGSKKYNQVKIQFFHVIAQARENDYSWAEVCHMLKALYSFKVSHAYVQSAYKKAQAEIAKEAEVANAKLS